MLYKKSGANVTFEAIDRLVGNEMGDYKVTTINESERLLINADKTIVLSDRTRLYFKEGKYIGSKANLTDDLELWEFAD